MPTLVLADDNPTVRELLRLYAERGGVEVVGEAADGREAVELADRLAPDAVILDDDMPVMRGLAALPLLRRRAPHTVAVMYSGDPSIERSAIAAGASAYLSKAASPRDVMSSVLTLLEPRSPCAPDYSPASFAASISSRISSAAATMRRA